jgi:hypothetical protein
MFKVRQLISYCLNPPLFKALFSLVLLLVLGACSDTHDDTQTSKTHVSGNAVKGVITNGLVSAYAIEANTKQLLLGQARTNSAGEYDINIPSLANNPIILLELTADSQTTMRCDRVDGCLYPEASNTSNILHAEFGKELPVPSNFKLIGYKKDENQQNTFISPLSHIIYTTASLLPGGISSLNLEAVSSWTAEIFNLGASPLTIKTPDLTALTNLNTLTYQQLKLGILSSAFYELTMTDDWSTGNIDLNQLPLEEIFRDIAHTAETLAERLSSEEDGSYSEALSIINTEAEVAVQTFESKQLVITQHPTSLTVNEAQSFSLNVQASGDGALAYQWSKNNINIPGATSASYGIASANLSNAGSYNVTITNNGILVTSLNALVSVNKTIEPISISQQPQVLNLTAGDSINLSVDITGDGPFYYQWQKEGSLLIGETNSALYIAESTEANSGTYRVNISNGVSEVSSNFVRVTVNAIIEPVMIIQHPQKLTVVEGDTAHFQIRATGGGFVTYQWRKNSINIPNAYTNQLDIDITDINNAGDYDAIVTNSRGSKTSNTATLTVISAEVPVWISIQPTSESVFLTDSINLRTTASGGGILSYQWFFNEQIIVGANQAEYSINTATLEDEGSYKVVVNNTYSTEESLEAFVSVTAKPVAKLEAKPSVQLSWEIPSFREDGSLLKTNEISAYILEYGNTPSNESESETVQITGSETTDYTILNLEPGTLYARIATIDSSNVQGQFSAWISITIE